LTDRGDVCLEAPVAGEAATVTVVPDLCLNNCTRSLEGSCEATLDGTTITVTSAFDWEVKTRGSCNLICGFPGPAECGDVGPLAEGTYTVVHGEETFDIDVPTGDGCGE